MQLQREILPLSATPKLKKHDRMLYMPLQFRYYENNALLDTGAVRNAMSERGLRCILTAHPSALLVGLPAPEHKIQIANGNIVPIRKQVQLRLSLARKIYEETFIVLPTIGNILIGLSFFRKYCVTRDLRNKLVHFPDLSLQFMPHHRKFKYGGFPTSYGANHHSNQTRHLLRNH